MSRKLFNFSAASVAAASMVLMLGLALAAQNQPANVAGTWQLSMQGRNGNTMTETMTVAQDGANIKGTMKGRRGDRNFTGTVDGNNVTWTVSFQTPNGRTFNMEYKATVSGDTMKGTMGGGRFSRDFTAQRGAGGQ